jgi:hypothetical protein
MSGAILFFVMPGLVPGIHVFDEIMKASRGWHGKSGLPDFRT